MTYSHFVVFSMNHSRKLQLSLALTFICFIYNLLVTILFFLDVRVEKVDGQNHHHCETCLELCGVWKCITVSVGESTKKMEMEDVFPFIVATAIVNLVLGVLAMSLLAWGLCQGKKGDEKNRELDENNI